MRDEYDFSNSSKTEHGKYARKVDTSQVSINTWPRLRDLPETEREVFRKWLLGKTRPPEVAGIPDADQDFYYSHDYDRWKVMRSIGLEIWD